MKAWEGVFTAPVAGRATKPRKTGYTMVIDKGLGLHVTSDLMAAAADYIDALKLTFGTSAFFDTDLLKQKTEIVRKAGVDIYPGGTFFEVAVWQKSVAKYLDRCHELGFTAVEISDGTIEMDAATRTKVIKAALKSGFKVITEVGKKDPKDAIGIPMMCAEVESDLALGVFKVIVEARESGKGVGVMDASGNVDAAEVEKITAGIKNPDNLIWEAPIKNQQLFFITRFGLNVSLGNIPPEDILALEALRIGLRGDTLKRAWLASLKK